MFICIMFISIVCYVHGCLHYVYIFLRDLHAYFYYRYYLLVSFTLLFVLFL